MCAALLLAGCGTSGGSSGEGSTTTTGPGTSTQTVAADKALAQAANLKLSDVPAGWTSAPQSQSTVDKALKGQVQQCLHADLVLFDENGPTLAQSPEFSDSSGDSVDSNVAYLPSASQAGDEMRIIQQPNFPTCLTSAANALVQNLMNNRSGTGSSLPQGASIGHITVAAMSFPSYGDQSAAFRTTLPIRYQGLTLSEYLDIVAFTKGRAIVGMDFSGSGSPLESSMEEHLTGVVKGRLTDT